MLCHSFPFPPPFFLSSNDEELMYRFIQTGISNAKECIANDSSEEFSKMIMHRESPHKTDFRGWEVVRKNSKQHKQRDASFEFYPYVSNSAGLVKIICLDYYIKIRNQSCIFHPRALYCICADSIWMCSL